MQVVTETVTVLTEGQGLTEVTAQVVDIVRGSSISEGLCTVFIQHTSASLIIQENADPSARRDLEYFLNKLVPENDPGFTHTAEGPDDMPSHMKAALTQTALSIPITKGRLVLGTWQGIYLWEHRTAPHHRRVVVSCV
ncbi:MAG: secondary thiamine-phosphate synthase enzyme YjbQ, partial [Bdellovibrionota bacterium]